MAPRDNYLHTPTTATASVPYPYRLVLTTLEPLMALGGVLQCLQSPQDYLSIMTRSRVPYDPSAHFLYTELAGSWLFLVFLEVFALRHLDDLRIWRWICTGLLFQDALYAWSVAEAVGGWAAWSDLRAWEGTDWLVFWTTAPAIAVRILIVLGVGIRDGKRKGN